ncbi:DUF3944 domain-containing protein [Halomonas sp. McH1-25]|uniref:DUF3944 domain-containing protein n=1 Tax=unclassified Halomonas TaxID=2609666 RepID=UPI001EF73ED3|nr:MULTISPECIES: DUF3944 domain-containing protein [unclassified Halomonas]MCG7602075.1 DUF3944 domain-containing protein [Halomonas sp. McH1-25]MCP1342911.1 DUF3944 domain-containing protein [Halomonas sp. FL8]MCP1362530.1 DUF3944 domain-containing protein [Halomonas sp. BBD45]MCP1363960.1 DUF3944 domain-containing protein [Halomonas sp. BBD48]
MGIEYRPDDDLAFLQYCTEEDIFQLAEFIIYDKDGKERFASEIRADPDFKNLSGKPDQWRKSWKLVAGELQHFGGDSFVNLLRRKGVTYREILVDVCEKLKVKYSKKSSAYDIENLLIERLVELSWEKMSDAERQEALKTVDVTSFSGPAWHLILHMIRSRGMGSLAWSSWLAQSARLAFTPFALTNIGASGAAGFLVQRSVTSFAGPLALVALTVPKVTGAAYRVTVPAVIQIAYMRRKYEQKDRF